MCLESPRVLVQLLKNRSQSEVLIFPHILETFPVLEKLVKLLHRKMFSLCPLNLSSHTFNLGHVIDGEYHSFKYYKNCMPFKASTWA